MSTELIYGLQPF